MGAPLPDAPASLADRRVFISHGVVFTVADLARRANVGDRGSFSPAGSAGLVEEHFRRSRGLLRADQLEAWLATWAIGPDDFRSWTEDAASTTTTATPWCAWLCSGGFDAAATTVATAVAAACELDEVPTDAATFEAAGWTERLLAERTTPAALTAVLEAHRLDWTHLETGTVTTAQRAVAEELRHQVLHDGLSLTEAAATAGCTVAESTDVLASVAVPGVRAALTGALPGELVGPVPTGESWSVITVHSRREPELADPATRARAEEAVRRDVITRAVARHVVA